MPANNRIYYASQAVTLTPQNSDGSAVYSLTYVPQGLQSVGMTTNFNLEQVFQLGQLELYDNLENVPEVEVTLNKVIDGTPPLYLMCMGGGTDGIAGANGKDLAELATNRVNFKLGIYKDTVTAASGAARHWVACSGMYLSAFTYTFPVEGNSTEEVTLVGNSKVWNSGVNGGAPNLAEFNRGLVPGGSGREGFSRAPTIARRYNINMAETILPVGKGGIPLPSGDSTDDPVLRANPYVNNITISSNLGREAIYELGRMAPYFRYVNFPVEITSEFEVTASDGDTVNADDFSGQTSCGQAFQNVVDKTIKVVVCATGVNNKLAIDLGGKNKLTSVNYSGGDTGGGNATITYSFQTFNSFKMTASGTYAAEAWVDNQADTTNYA